MNGEIKQVVVITGKDLSDVLAVVGNMAQAHDWIENGWGRPADAWVRDGIVWDDGRVTLLDQKLARFYEYDGNYTSEPKRRRRELQKQAKSKMTDEELEAFGWTRPV